MSGIGVRGVRLQSCFFSSASPLWAKLVGSSFLWLSTARNYQRYCLSYVWLHTFNTAALRIQQENHFQHPPPTKKKKKMLSSFSKDCKVERGKKPRGKVMLSLCSQSTKWKKRARNYRAGYLSLYVCVCICAWIIISFLFFFSWNTREGGLKASWKKEKSTFAVYVASWKILKGPN